MPSSLNGTGVTFNDATTLQSGNIPAANLGSGTANSSVFLRGDKVWASVPAAAPSTAQVLGATASASAGAVGTYAFLGNNVNIVNTFNTTIAGSGLNPAGIGTGPGFGFASDFPTSGSHRGEFTPQAGTWRCMGVARGGNNSAGASLWLRIS